ncbi:hypothetical protein EDB19DRAFT_1822233 [Suillus lakei]|nr:hypothetical protein EDB19DRAFT_1822233 [Suillus lakei]
MISTISTTAYDLRSFSYVQIAVAVAVLYDHALTFGRERRSPSLVAALYLLDRYLGDSVVILGAYLCLTEVASTQILMILVFAFFSEVLAVVVIIWRTIGPTSKLVVSLNNMRDRKATLGTSSLRVNSFMSILVRDSILYFFMSVSSFQTWQCVPIVMGLWRNAAALHANISIPFIMLVETVIGTRMVINFKEHCSRRLSSEPIMITGSIRFAGVSEETARPDTIYDQSKQGEEEVQPIKG